MTGWHWPSMIQTKFIESFTFSDLGCMYRLFYKVENGLRTICDAMSCYLRQQGKAIVSDDEDGEKNAINFIQVVL